MSKYILGLDMGIASVGWAVIDSETEEIIESGVRLFESGGYSKSKRSRNNKERRRHRGVRRNKRRKKHRLERLNDFLGEVEIHRPENYTGTPVEVRLKGLSGKLSKDEIYVALYNITKHRGVSYLEDIEEVKENDNLVKNLEKLKNEGYIYPCQIQNYRYEKYGFFRGTQLMGEESFMNVFAIGMYEKEVRKILETQKSFYKNITDEFIEGYIKILKSKREYYVGPGNNLSRTNYGIYKTNGRTIDNLFDELRGKCSIYNGKNGMEEEFRASGASYTVQYYNLLNDLCNIKVDGIKLSKQEKEEIIEEIKNNETAMKITAALKKLYKTAPESVSGYRVDKADKEENHSFETYRSMRKFFKERNIRFNFTIEQLDAIGDILTLNTETDGIYKYFNNSKRKEYATISNLTEQDKEAFVAFRRAKSELFNKGPKWSSFSYKLINQIVPEMLESGDEQHTCINRMELKKYSSESKNKLDYISITDEIYNPVVVRTVIQTTKIINELLKKYEFKDIVIEMAREKNDDDARKQIKDRQKANEDIKKKAIEYCGISESDLDFRNHKNLMMKLKLLYKQQGKCLYSGKPINRDMLIANQHAYEIDHIIPISISFDDSQANKVLVESKHNAEKGNRTPFNYLSSSKDTWEYKTYKKYVLGLYKEKFIKEKQKDLLLFEEDITKEAVVQKFINRNLNDTRFSSKKVLNELQAFFSNNKMDTKIKVINGSMTHQFRKNILHYNKDRDLDFRHHAEDAAICCFAVSSLKRYGQEFVDIETGKIIGKEDLFSKKKTGDRAKYISLSAWEVERKLNANKEKIKFSHKVDRKINRSVSDETVYSTRKEKDEIRAVNKISDIYNDKDAKKKIKEKEESFLMYKHDPKTWAIIKSVIETYPGEKNPFKKYMEEYGPIRKYSKKGNGPIVKELKYLGDRVVSHIDITDNYKNSKNKIFLTSLKPYRADIYYDKNKDCFNVVPIRYNDFKFEKGEYILPISRYEELLKNENLLSENQSLRNLEENGHEFRFSLYKNDVFEIGTESERNTYRFLAKNHAAKNTFEVKHIEEKLN